MMKHGIRLVDGEGRNLRGAPALRFVLPIPFYQTGLSPRSSPHHQPEMPNPSSVGVRRGRYLYHPGGARTPPPVFSLYAPISRGLQADWPPTPAGGWLDDSPTVRAQEMRSTRLARQKLPKFPEMNKENGTPPDLFKANIPDDAKPHCAHGNMQACNSSADEPLEPNMSAATQVEQNKLTFPSGIPDLGVEPLQPRVNGAVAPLDAAYGVSDIGLNEHTLGFQTAVGLPLSADFVAGVRFLSYDPRKPSPSNVEILSRLGGLFSSGITKAELRQILRRCKLCRRFMFIDRCGYHRCDGAGSDTKDPQFSLVNTLLATSEGCGISQGVLSSLLSICQSCRRIVGAAGMEMHICGEIDYN
ncbi:hypothetical protein NMY22_g15764 [Coprinellus aureogranulatus]|nr:hypothetical protein NMY22_g15764 [Coprinellus aureogranulatus]